jgi:hypothetical protein
MYRTTSNAYKTLQLDVSMTQKDFYFYLEKHQIIY